MINNKNKIVSKKNLIELLKKLKRRKKKIVITNGCFDILHPGHISYLKKSKQLGDILIVLINTDKSVKTNKGNKRPINNLVFRQRMISELSSVDYVVSFSTKTPENLYKILSPDILTKGKDMINKTIAGAKNVKQNGGKVKLIRYDKKYSTTKIIKKIIKSYQE